MLRKLVAAGLASMVWLGASGGISAAQWCPPGQVAATGGTSSSGCYYTNGTHVTPGQLYASQAQPSTSSSGSTGTPSYMGRPSVLYPGTTFYPEMWSAGAPGSTGASSTSLPPVSPAALPEPLSYRPSTLTAQPSYAVPSSVASGGTSPIGRYITSAGSVEEWVAAAPARPEPTYTGADTTPIVIAR
jgi:hypothetical protein